MKFVIHPQYESCKNEILAKVINFKNEGVPFGDSNRNVIKIFDFPSYLVNIKSFKVPAVFNQIIYFLFRKSKAERSFNYAVRLLENEIGTPQPIAYVEKYSILGLHCSYYISEHMPTELTFRELVTIPDYPQHEVILRQFTAFCFDLHQKGIEFLDHSPGNTLIKKISEDKYAFFLVDLNRMKFHQKMDMTIRMKNLRRLTYKMEMLAIMSDEYARLAGKDPQYVFEEMKLHTENFHRSHQKKRRLKKKLLFWRKYPAKK
jgi:hypothetical protein